MGRKQNQRYVKLNERHSECGINAFINMRCIALIDVEASIKQEAVDASGEKRLHQRSEKVKITFPCLSKSRGFRLFHLHVD